MNQYKSTLESLANGVNPIDGESFSADSPYNHPEIIRALYKTLNELDRLALLLKPSQKTEQEKQAENIKNGVPKNRGLPWLSDDRAALKQRYIAGDSVQTLAKHFERSLGSIQAELSKQNLLPKSS